ncbi:MAG: peroxidase-related enzyme [Candidatus Acidiferrales bacterium]
MESLEMKAMFLPGVQNNPQPSPYFNMIRSAQDSGQEYWQIWHLFAFRPEMTAHLARFTHALMHEESPLSSGLRELIAAYTSYLNECEFCAKSHAAIAAEFLGGDEFVWSVLRDPESSSLPENEKALLRFVAKVTKDLPSITGEDVERLHEIGWLDDAIFYALTVCAMFNFYNRWVTASGVHAVSHEGHRVRAEVMAKNGYIRK